MDPVASTVLTAAASSVVSAVVSAAVASAKGAGKRAADDSAALKAGMRALLWRELQTIHALAMDRGGLTVAERRHLESVYSAYHALGGNGTGTRLFEDAMNMPVID